MTGFRTLERVEASLEVAPADRFLVRGADAADLLHRISASAVAAVEPGQARHLVFTDDKGALVGAPLVERRDGDFAFVAGPGRGTDLRAWIAKWIIVEDVRIEDDPEPAFRLGEADLASGTVTVPSTPAGPPILRAEAAPSPVDPATWQELLFRAGRFQDGPGTAGGPIPLELGWQDLIAFDKGCYIGQEVIARLANYGKVRRTLASARFAGPKRAGDPVVHGGRRRGVVLESFGLDEGHYAWILVERDLPEGAALDGGTETAGTLLGAPAA